MLTGIGIGALAAIIGFIVVVLTMCCDIGTGSQLRGCRNCKHLWVNCQGRTYCEAWEELE